jgi:type II secretory ATPase GspE/PulE/Tfp pilus assembly ATPase PilB-like protein
MFQDFTQRFKQTLVNTKMVPMTSALATIVQHGQSHPDKADANLNLLKKLQILNERIASASNTDQALADLPQQACSLFDCDQFTLYLIDHDTLVMACHHQAGIDTCDAPRLPISEQSVAGHVAMHGRLVCVHDAYDEIELGLHVPPLPFSHEIDDRSGYRTRQMLVAPVLDVQGHGLLGVVQLVNNRLGGPFGNVLEQHVTVLCKSIGAALYRCHAPLPQIRSKYKFLIADGTLTSRNFELATRAAAQAGSDIEQALVSDFHVKLSQIGAALASFFGVAYEPFRADRIKPIALLKNVKREFAEYNGWLLIDGDQNALVILALDPDQVKNSQTVNNIFPKEKLIYRVTTNREFKLTVDQFFGIAGDAGSVDELLLSMKGNDDENDLTQEVSAAVENELVKLVNKIIIDAHHQGASDIHIEPGVGKEKTLIRLRKDGSLEPYTEVPAMYRNALLVRIKIMCDLDISEHRKPQDGKIKFRKYGPLDIELRVVCIPSSGGVEDVVMRILTNGEPMPLAQLGIAPDNLRRLKAVVGKPYGLFFVCGPTGSGKTTTLHSVLSYLNTSENKIWTVEDPVEITQKGLRQVQVNRKAGLDFATVIRSFLRADPDIIMVGEMRDKETVSIGLEASLTGHLVLSTLHTNSAPESVVRLLDMGMDPFNFADALLGVLAQRLVKRLCLHCKKSRLASSAEIDDMLTEYCQEMPQIEGVCSGAGKEQLHALWCERHADSAGAFTLYQAVGCAQCNHGYKGRVGLHELMVGTDKVKQLIQEHARMAQLQAAAIRDGMLTLKMDGIEKVLAGLVDMKQVRLACIR